MIYKGVKRFPETIKEVAPTKHKYGADVTVSFHTDTYKPSVDGHGVDFEINAFKHNFKGTILLNYKTDGLNETIIKDAVKTGVLDAGAYFRSFEEVEPQLDWLKLVLGKNPAYWSYANGLRDYDDFVSTNGLVSRLSSVSDVSYDFDERLGHKVASLFNYNVRDIDTATAINNAKTALQQSINNKGWYNDFSHWHWAEFYGDKNQFNQLMSEFQIMLNGVNYVALGASEAVSYMWLRKQYVRGGLYQDNNELVLINETKNSNNIPYNAIDTTLSVEVDLTGTILENKDIASNVDIIKKSNNKFIIQVPYSKYDGFRTVRLKETTSPNYLNFDKPVISNTQLSGNVLNVTTDKPTNIVVFSTPNDSELYTASILSRSNIMSENHNVQLSDITSKDIYIGAISKEGQSILSNKVSV